MGQHIIDSVNAKMTNDASFNSLMLQQMSAIQLFQISIDGLHDTTMDEWFTTNCNSQVPSMPSFVVGLDNIVNDVKHILLQNGVSISGVEGMGGSSKSTLAMIPKPKPPNVKALLETVWDKIIGASRPVF